MNGERSIIALELDKVLARASGYCHGAAAANAMLSLRPQSSFDAARLLLEQTSEADIILHEHVVSPEFAFDDVSACLDAAEKMSTLSALEVRRVGVAMRTARLCAGAIDNVPDDRIKHIREISSLIGTDRSLEKHIFDAISQEGELTDEASGELRRLRAAIKAAGAAVRSRLNAFLTGAQSKFLMENLVTVREGRYVLPVKAECRSSVPGLLHDRSASGSTVYIEPYALVEMNNEIRALKAQESAECERILQAFTHEIRGESENIKRSCAAVSALDVIFAKARYARDTKAVMPAYSDDGKIDVKEGRHPLIDGKKVVPVSVRLGGEFNVMIISGPNTGGKTVTLKLCGLFALMSACGFFLPCAEGSRMSWFEEVFCDIGDDQSIELALSTFSSHVVNVAKILKNANARSLVLLDELGAGTDPAEGSALAVACAEKLLSIGCRCMITSHFDELKSFSARSEGVMNASMDFDPVTFAPTYRLLYGVAGSSNALEIAARFDMPAEVLKRAHELISPEKRELSRLIAGAERALRDAEAEREKAKKERSEADAELEKAKLAGDAAEQLKDRLEEKIRRGYRELLADYVEEAEELVESIKQKVKEGDERALFEARRLKNKLAEKAGELPERSGAEGAAGEISEGDTVFVKSLGKTGVVLNINKKGEYTVKAGVLTTIVPAADVYKAQKSGEKSAPRRVGEYYARPDVSFEIDLRGQTREEAEYNTDIYLSNAAQAGLHEVRLIHGKGSGALRAALQSMLKNDPRVLSFRTGGYGEGDNGVTVVTLK